VRKFSHSGGVKGRRERALDRLESVKEPNKRQLKEIDILKGKVKRHE